MRGCTISNTDNTKKYLKANDWTKWEDGTTSSQDNCNGINLKKILRYKELLVYARRFSKLKL